MPDQVRHDGQEFNAFCNYDTVWKTGILETSLNKQSTVYILASKRNGTLYIGVTSELAKRIWEHKNNMETGID